MGMSVDEIAGQSNTALDQIWSHPVGSIVALIGVALVGSWLVAEVFEFFQDRERQRRRFALR
jgi:hypothetical protein